MKLNELTKIPGSTTEAKRIGRGHGSGNGKTAGKGHKGQKARAGHGFRAGFEGGQMPLQRRIPKRGFNNIFATEVTAINVSALNVFEDGAVVDLAALIEAGLVNNNTNNIKVLPCGEISKKLTVVANKFTKSAEKAIVDAGGKIEVI